MTEETSRPAHELERLENRRLKGTGLAAVLVLTAAVLVLVGSGCGGAKEGESCGGYSDKVSECASGLFRCGYVPNLADQVGTRVRTEQLAGGGQACGRPSSAARSG